MDNAWVFVELFKRYYKRIGKLAQIQTHNQKLTKKFVIPSSFAVTSNK